MIYQQEIEHKILNNLFLTHLLMEQETLILVFRVPQSVQKVKTAKFHKPYGITETKK